MRAWFSEGQQSADWFREIFKGLYAQAGAAAKPVARPPAPE